MPVDSLNLNTVPLHISSQQYAEVDIANGGPGTVYYKSTRDVSSGSNDGSITAGTTRRFRSPQWIVATTPTKVFVDHIEHERDTIEVHGIPDTSAIEGGNVLNVAEPSFGAVGDGVTDDLAAVEAAIDTSPEGSVIHFPMTRHGGTYLLGTSSGGMTISDRSGLRFTCDPGVVIKRKDSGDTEHRNMLFVFDHCTDIHISGDFQFDVNRAHRLSNPLRFVSCERCYVEPGVRFFDSDPWDTTGWTTAGSINNSSDPVSFNVNVPATNEVPATPSSQPFYITIDSEVLLVNNRSAVSSTVVQLTAARAQIGTSIASHSSGATITGDDTGWDHYAVIFTGEDDDPCIDCHVGEFRSETLTVEMDNARNCSMKGTVSDARVGAYLSPQDPDNVLIGNTLDLLVLEPRYRGVVYSDESSANSTGALHRSNTIKARVRSESRLPRGNQFRLGKFSGSPSSPTSWQDIRLDVDVQVETALGTQFVEAIFVDYPTGNHNVLQLDADFKYQGPGVANSVYCIQTRDTGRGEIRTMVIGSATHAVSHGHALRTRFRPRLIEGSTTTVQYATSDGEAFLDLDGATLVGGTTSLTNLAATDTVIDTQVERALGTGTTVDVTNGGRLWTTATSANNVSTITGGREGKIVEIRATGDRTFVHGSALVLQGATDFAMTSGATLTLRYLSSAWREISRRTA